MYYIFILNLVFISFNYSTLKISSPFLFSKKNCIHTLPFIKAVAPMDNIFVGSNYVVVALPRFSSTFLA